MKSQTTPFGAPSVLKQHFAHHLNRVYYGKNYLQQHLPELIAGASFKRLKQGIQEVLDDVSEQILRIEEIYRIIDIQPSAESSVPLIAVFKDAFDEHEHHEDNPLLNDIDIILYVQLLEHINLTSFRMLEILAAALSYKQIKQLLLESFDEATDNDKLFVLIANEYIKK